MKKKKMTRRLQTARESPGLTLIPGTHFFSPSSHDPAQFQHFQRFRTFAPVVAPADDHVARLGIVSVEGEVFAFVFKLDAQSLPLAGVDFSAGLGGPGTSIPVFHLQSRI